MTFSKFKKLKPIFFLLRYFLLGLLIGFVFFVVIVFWIPAVRHPAVKPIKLNNTQQSVLSNNASEYTEVESPAETPERISKDKNELKYTDGNTQTILVQLPENFYIAETAVSPNGQKIAYTYFDSNANFFYHLPPMGMNVFDLDVHKNIELFPPKDLSAAYLSWSEAGKYLSTWLGEGKMSVVYDASDYTKAFEIKSADWQSDEVRWSRDPVSPIWFVPGNENKIAYDNGDLVEAEIVGFEKNIIIKRVQTVFDAFESPFYPIAPAYSRDANYIALFNSDKDLIIYNRKTNKTKILMPHVVEDSIYTGEPDNFMAGELFGFDLQNNLIFSPYKPDNPRQKFLYDTKTEKAIGYNE